jgi:alkylation response protein AidB-like acyl-CoA dehydrogenase
MTIGDSLTLREDQHALTETLRGFLAGQLPSDVLRSQLETVAGYSPQLHARLAGEFGLTALTIPVEYGGRGLPLTEAVAVHAELGRALYPGPLLASSLAAAVLLTAGDGEAAAYWLPRLADGSLNGTVAAAGETGNWVPGADSVRAELTPDGWELTGRRWFVTAAHVAGIVAVPAITDDGLAMFLVEAGSPGYGASGQLRLDLTRRVCVTTFDAAPARLLAQGEQAIAALYRAEREFLFATAAEAAGGIGWCLERAVEYAREREQSGDSIGSFQAVAQACVDLLADFETVLAAARHAAKRTGEDAPDATTAAHAAALRAGEAYRRTTDSAVHLFGGAGSVWEHDVQLYYRRAWSAERLAGGPQSHRAATSGS